MARISLGALLALMSCRSAYAKSKYFWDDSALNDTCSWLTPETPESTFLTWRRKKDWNWKRVRSYFKDPEQEPDDHPRRQRPACYAVTVVGSEAWHYESKGHIYRVRAAEACCLRQEHVPSEFPAIVSFKPTRWHNTFRFCECPGVDPLKPDTYCAGMSAEDLVCPIGVNATTATCNDTSALTRQPEGCDGYFPPEPNKDKWWVAPGNVSMDRACRRSTPYDLSESYYGKFFCTTTLEDCKDHCARTAGCKGVEFTKESGRCETWFEDINATWELFGVQCLRYEGPPALKANLDFTLHPDGDNRACRGSSSPANSVCDYSVHNNGAKAVSALTLEECMERCRSIQGCKGIEYKEADGYCEAWTTAITTTASVPGYSCYLAGSSSNILLP